MHYVVFSNNTKNPKYLITIKRGKQRGLGDHGGKLGDLMTVTWWWCDRGSTGSEGSNQGRERVCKEKKEERELWRGGGRSTI